MEPKIPEGEPVYMVTSELFDFEPNDRPDEIYAFKVVRASRYDAIAAELAETKRALAVVQDTSIAHAGKQSDLLERTLKEGYDIQARQRDHIRELEAALDWALDHTKGIETQPPELAGILDASRERIRSTLETPAQHVCACEFGSCYKHKLESNQYCHDDRKAAGLAQSDRGEKR
jgi:hypothetical protein